MGAAWPSPRAQQVRTVSGRGEQFPVLAGQEAGEAGHGPQENARSAGYGLDGATVGVAGAVVRGERGRGVVAVAEAGGGQLLEGRAGAQRGGRDCGEAGWEVACITEPGDKPPQPDGRAPPCGGRLPGRCAGRGGQVAAGAARRSAAACRQQARGRGCRRRRSGPAAVMAWSAVCSAWCRAAGRRRRWQTTVR